MRKCANLYIFKFSIRMENETNFFEIAFLLSSFHEYLKWVNSTHP